MAVNRSARDTQVEQLLVELRLAAYPLIKGAPGRSEWPPRVPDPFPGATSPPEVSRDELTAPLLAGAITHHGSLLVRGLLDQPRVDQLVEDIDQAIAAYDERAATADPLEPLPPWYVPMHQLLWGSALGALRDWTRTTGGVCTVESPRALFDVIDAFDEIGLSRLITEHLGERPALAINKWTLRRVPTSLLRADWHQDGAFLGDGVRTVNVWLALSTCGGDSDAPGLDVVPRRLDSVVETGTYGAEFEWSVGPDLIGVLMDGGQAVRPLFQPGDALLFDELMLHRGGVTLSVDEAMASPDRHLTRERYAIESWFFAPSTYPVRPLAHGLLAPGHPNLVPAARDRSAGGGAAVDRQDGAVDVVGLVGADVGDHGGDRFGLLHLAGQERAGDERHAGPLGRDEVVQEVGVDAARAHGVEAHALAAELDGHGPGQPDQRVLRRAVGGDVGLADEPGGRGQVQDVALALEQVGQRGLAEVERARPR